MTSVMNFCEGDIARLRTLSDDLEEILLSIGYDGKARDWEYIRANQIIVTKKYGDLRNSLRKDMALSSYETNSALGTAVASVLDAYDGLQDILFSADINDDETAGHIEEEAKDLLYESLIFPGAMQIDNHTVD